MLNIYVLHYQDDALTGRCVESLLRDDWVFYNCNIYVVDNGSPEPIDWYFSGVEIIRHERNLHLIPALNEAMKRTRGYAYWCLNNDVRPAVGCAKVIYEAFNDGDMGIVAPGSSDMSTGILYAAGPEPGVILPAPHVDNHAWAFCDDVVQAIGWPDAEGHPHRANWYANRMYCWKARKAGYRVACVRGGWVEHDHKGGFDAVADYEGYKWIQARLGEQVEEAL